MRDVATGLASWLEDRKPLALATVVGTWGSSPRRPGARMVVDAEGRITGSVSGGCVEASVVETAHEVMSDGRSRLLGFRVSDETAWEVGLACGGSLEVFVAVPQEGEVAVVLDALEQRRAVAWAVVLDGEHRGLSGGRTIEGELFGDLEIASFAASPLEAGQPARFETDRGTVFCDVITPPETLVMIGGVHIAQSLAILSEAVGIRPVICDPRPVFASPGRFPGVEIVNEWPGEGLERIGLDAGVAVATLTHDPKLDDPALLRALPSDAFYVGALGSRRTHAKRVERLRGLGLDEASISRLRAPIGLPIGARTPEQIALAILAEVVAARNDAR